MKKILSIFLLVLLFALGKYFYDYDKNNNNLDNFANNFYNIDPPKKSRLLEKNKKVRSEYKHYLDKDNYCEYHVGFLLESSLNIEEVNQYYNKFDKQVIVRKIDWNSINNIYKRRQQIHSYYIDDWRESSLELIKNSNNLDYFQISFDGRNKDKYIGWDLRCFDGPLGGF